MAIKPFNGTQRYFEYFQGKIREKYAAKELKVEESATWWMKTLYFVCLQSTVEEEK